MPKRETCRFWGQVEQMFVTWSRPHKVWLCDLTDEQNPDCDSCQRWEPKKIKIKHISTEPTDEG